MSVKRLVFAGAAVILGTELVNRPEDSKPHTHLEMEEPLTVRVRRPTVYGIVELVTLQSRRTGEVIKVISEDFVLPTEDELREREQGEYNESSDDTLVGIEKV